MASVSEELERLFGLFERGAITREEYDQQKAALLSGSSSVSSPGVPNQAS